MRGLTRGEQSTSSYPILQLFCRSGGFLADMYSGTFRVDDIRFGLTNLVAETPFSEAHKLGTGRYVIPTGETATWSVGTHRAICQYKMTETGPTLTQEVQFEVLSPTDWPSGSAYCGYLSTKRAFSMEYLNEDQETTRGHMWINRISRMIERWTMRFFEPRYLTIRLDGPGSPRLLLQEAVIAIEDIYAVWPNALGSEDYYKYEQYLYKVWNRHLDGVVGADDDRSDPKIVLSGFDGHAVKVSDYAWPRGEQNLKVIGVFGYTDPDIDPTTGRALVGQTPSDIVEVTGVLLSRYVQDPTLSNPLVLQPGAVRSYRTRDQAITFGSTGGGGGGGGGSGSRASDMSGDPIVDSILARYSAPVALVGA